MMRLVKDSQARLAGSSSPCTKAPASVYQGGWVGAEGVKREDGKGQFSKWRMRLYRYRKIASGMCYHGPLRSPKGMVDWQ